MLWLGFYYITRSLHIWQIRCASGVELGTGFISICASPGMHQKEAWSFFVFLTYWWHADIFTNYSSRQELIIFHNKTIGNSWLYIASDNERDYVMVLAIREEHIFNFLKKWSKSTKKMDANTTKEVCLTIIELSSNTIHCCLISHDINLWKSFFFFMKSCFLKTSVWSHIYSVVSLIIHTRCNLSFFYSRYPYIAVRKGWCTCWHELYLLYCWTAASAFP